MRDLGGVTACDCAEGAAMTTTQCDPVAYRAGDPGGANLSLTLETLQVCAPQPPVCGEWGWLEKTEIEGRHGIMCESSMPTREALTVPAEPTCDDLGMPDPSGGCGCVVGSRGGLIGAMLTLLGLLGLRRRRN